MRTFAAAALLTLALAPAAFAGGFTTVGVDSLPAASDAGGTWTPQITILGHGRTPAEGMHPVVVLTSADGETKRFRAYALKRPGAYTTRVAVPSGGRWQVAVDEGWGNLHAFGTVALGDGAPATAAAAPAGDDGGNLVLPLLAALIAGTIAALLTALLGAALERRRPARPSPSAT